MSNRIKLNHKLYLIVRHGTYQPTRSWIASLSYSYTIKDRIKNASSPDVIQQILGEMEITGLQEIDPATASIKVIPVHEMAQILFEKRPKKKS